jgi:hypothetical protein
MDKYDFQNELMDNIDDKTMINAISNVMLFELSKLSEIEKLNYIKGILWELNRESLEAFFDDLGCLEAHCDQLTDSIEYRKAAF